MTIKLPKGFKGLNYGTKPKLKEVTTGVSKKVKKTLAKSRKKLNRKINTGKYVEPTTQKGSIQDVLDGLPDDVKGLFANDSITSYSVKGDKLIVRTVEGYVFSVIPTVNNIANKYTIKLGRERTQYV